ncbi:hypothetical protein CR62_24195 [Serratia grimesii]|uniref:Uncharacterized protein n=1 Tax=Serratia grimesii TaxID=82995 RepID=A0ABR4UAF9_9GAMM|nr:hypothetical protein CR62_24195 [Serratia grimesii]
MAWDIFVYENVRKQLIAEGFSEALAVVGGITQRICIAGSHRRARKVRCMTTVSLWLGGMCWGAAQRTRSRDQGRKKAEQLQLVGHHFSEN